MEHSTGLAVLPFINGNLAFVRSGPAHLSVQLDLPLLPRGKDVIGMMDSLETWVRSIQGSFENHIYRCDCILLKSRYSINKLHEIQ
jgi:hypothetical protein